MSEYKNSIQLSVKIDPQNQAQKNLNEIIKKLNENKINLDLTIKGDASKQLENLSTLIDTLKSKMGTGISLGDLDKAINNSVSGLTKLNGELQKVSQTNYNDGSKKIITETATAIGEIVSQTQKLAKDGTPIGDGVAKTTKNYLEQAKAIESVSKAQEKLNNLKLVNQNEVSNLKGLFTNISTSNGKGYSANELNGYLNKVKELEVEENKLKQIKKEELDLINQMANAREKAQINNKNNNKAEDLAQTRAINQALEDNYKTSLKEADAQKQVQKEIQKQIKLLEIQKSSLNRQYGNKVDTSSIDNAISKLKSMDNINMKNLRNEISNIGVGIKDITEKARSSESVLGKLGNSLKNVGIYFDVGDIFRSLVNGAKEAVDYVMDVENSMIDLRRVVTMSDADAQNFQNNMHNISMELASTNANTISSVATFAKLGYSLKDATNLGEIATKYNFSADINDINSATTSLIATLKGFGLEASNAIKITDEINQVSNNYAVKAIDINEMLSRSSATLGTFGNSLEESIALGSTANEIMQNASTVGQALKSIAPRLTTNSNSLKQLKEFNIGIEDSKGNLKSTYQIFKELAPIMKDLKGEDLAQASNSLFGKQNISTGLAVIKNAEQLDNIMKTLKNSTGSVDKEFDRYLNSTKAKISQLKESLGGLYSQFINSTMTKGSVDGLNSFVTALTSVISKLGTIPSVIATVVGSLTLFNSKFREAMTSYQPSFVTNWNRAFTGLKTTFGEVANKAQENVTATRKSITAMNEQGNATLGAKAKLVGYQTQLGLATVAEKACAVGAEVMGVAFNMALGLGIGLAIQAITSFISRAETLKQTNQELLSSIQSIGSDTKEIEELKNKFTSLSEEIQKGGLSAEETKTKKQELSSVYDQLIQKSPELKNLIDLESGSYDKQVESIQGLIDKKNEEMGLKAEQYIKDNGVSDSSVEEKIKEMTRLKNELSFMEKNLERTDLTDSQRKNSQDYATNLKTDISALKTSLSEIITVQDTLNKVGSKYGVSSDSITSAQKSIDSVKLYGQAIEDNTNKTNTNTKAKIDNSDVDIDTDEVNAEQEKAQAIQKSTEEYQKSTQAIAKAQGFIDKLNKTNAVTPQLAGQISKSYKDMTTDINNVGDTVDFLKGKIQEQQEAQSEALMVLKGEDSQYYSERVANNENYENQINDFLARFTGNSQQAYNVDLSQFTTLNQMKAGVQSTLKSAVDSFLSQFVDTSSSAYQVDYSNFSSLISAKKEVLGQMAGSMATFWDETSKSFNGQAYGGMDLSGNASDSMYKAYEDKAKGVLGLGDKIRTAMKGLDGIYAGGGLNFQGFDGGGGISDFGGTGGGKGSSDNSAKKALEEAEKWRDKINELNSSIDINTYTEDNNKLAQLDSQLQAVKTSQDGLTGSELANSKAKENEIIQKQIDIYKHLVEMQGMEKDHIASLLSNYGILTDETGNLTNATEKLSEAQQKADSMSGSTEDSYNAKKYAIDQVKSLNDLIVKHGELTNKTIPETVNKWEELANTIKKAKEEARQANIETVTNLRDKLVSAILEEAQEKVDKLKEQLSSQKEDALTDLEERKQASIDAYDAEIKSLQDELDAMNDESDNNEEKLAKLKAERELWLRDSSTESTAKIKELDNSISDLELTIQKDNLQTQIDTLNDAKTEESDDYDEQISDLNNYYDKQEEKAERTYKKMLSEKKAYAQADKLLTSNNQKAILKILNDNSENYKDVGTLLGKNFSDAFKAELSKAQDALRALKDIEIEEDSSSGSSSSGSKSADTYSGTGSGTTSSGTKYTTTSNGIISSNPITSSDLAEIDSSSKKKYYNANTGKDEYFSADTGGRTPSNIGSDGALGILHKDEKILNAKDTVQFDNAMLKIDDIYKNIKIADAVILQLSNMIGSTGNYSLPSTISQIDLNKLANSVTTNSNTDNSNSSNVSIQNTYQVDATSDFKVKNFSNNLDKLFKDTLRKNGILKR